MIFSVQSARGFIEIGFALCGMISKVPFAIRIDRRSFRRSVAENLNSAYIRLTNSGVTGEEKYITPNFGTKITAAKWQSLEPSLWAHMDLMTQGRQRGKSEMNRQRRYKRFMANWFFFTFGAAIDRLLLIDELQSHIPGDDIPHYKILDHSGPFVDSDHEIIPFLPEEDLKIPYPCFFTAIFMKRTKDKDLQDALRLTRSMGLYTANGNLYIVYFLFSPLWEEFNVKGTGRQMPDPVRDAIVNNAKEENKKIKEKGGKYKRVGYYYGCETRISSTAKTYGDRFGASFVCPIIIVRSKEDIADVILRPARVNMNGHRTRKENELKLVPSALGFESHIILPMDRDGIRTAALVSDPDWQIHLNLALMKLGLTEQCGKEPYDGIINGRNITELLSCNYGKLERCFDAAREAREGMAVIGFEYQEEILKKAYPKTEVDFFRISPELYREKIVPAYNEELKRARALQAAGITPDER